MLIKKIKLTKLLLIIVIFFVAAYFKGGNLHYYNPGYDYDSDKVFSYIRKSSTKGVIVSGYVQSLKGLNLQVSTGKQYFVPMIKKISFKKFNINLFCYDNPNLAYPDFVELIKACFKNRSLNEWRLIAELYDSNLILTRNDFEISNLEKIASNEDFNLYEVK